MTFNETTRPERIILAPSYCRSRRSSAMGLPASDEMIMLLNRRRFLAGASALAVAPLWPRHALAADSYSFKQGNFEITVVSDGFITLPGGIIAPDASPEELAEILRRL